MSRVAVSTTAGATPGAACRHGLPAVCRFANAAGGGCRWGDRCRYCHICERTSAYGRIRRALEDRRTAKVAKTETWPSGSGISSASADLPSFLGLLCTCPELLLEGPFGDALPASSLAALPCIHKSAAALVAGGAACLIWRTQLRRLGATGLQVSSAVTTALTVEELRRAVRVLSQVRFKSPWCLGTRQELDDAISAAEEAYESASYGATLFGFVCKYGHGSRNSAAGLPAEDVRVDEPARVDAVDVLEAAADRVQPDDGSQPNGGEEELLDTEEAGDRHNTEGPEEDEDEDEQQEEGSAEWALEVGARAGAGARDGTWVIAPGGGASWVVVPEVDGTCIEMPGGWRFRVAPVLVAKFATGDGADSREHLACRLRPFVLGARDAGPLPNRAAQFEAALFSATPGVCRFSALALQQGRELTRAESQRLLGGSQALRLVVAVKCSQRFWELPLK
eukprot:gnl/TRDRNA2_/TRDRNA2_35659_c0_seq1.p1 gnl/TRDRNA2_/TRDRNA2_35659_c0~~gnl/TRDRNA2_/TRDRNA2_35659_c0_seq1.p1  ORF type:complete len:452 (-),score=76.07 gnl/TRDRNA2_/TRDRNA2_35659_c0_seq1:98-1453(-)